MNPLFRRSRISSGKDALCGITKNGFLNPIAHLELDRNMFGEFVEFVIEERQPCLDRMSHFLAVAKEAENIERHRCEPRFLDDIDHRRVGLVALRNLCARSLDLMAPGFCEHQERNLPAFRTGKSSKFQSPRLNRGCRTGRARSVGVSDRIGEEFLIAEKHLVGALSSQHYGYELACFQRQQELAHRREADERQFRVPETFLEVVPEHLLGHLELVMLDPTNSAARRANCFSLRPLPSNPIENECGTDSRLRFISAAMSAEINSAAQIQSNGHVCAEPQANRFFQFLQHSLRVGRHFPFIIGDRLGHGSRDLARPIIAGLGSCRS